MNNDNCLSNMLEKIVLMQQFDRNNNIGCDRPMLQDSLTIVNTRPINLYCCCTNTIWTMPYDYNDLTGNSTTFRVENVNDNYATFRILIDNDGSYTATDNFFIIDLSYISCIKCLQDTLITNI